MAQNQNLAVSSWPSFDEAYRRAVALEIENLSNCGNDSIAEPIKLGSVQNWRRLIGTQISVM